MKKDKLSGLYLLGVGVLATYLTIEGMKMKLKRFDKVYQQGYKNYINK